MVRMIVAMAAAFATAAGACGGETAAPEARMVFQDFDGGKVPLDGDGDTCPQAYSGAGSAAVSIEAKDSIRGSSLRVVLTSG